MPMGVPSYFLNVATDRVYGTDTGANQTGNHIFFSNSGAGANNSGNFVIGLGENAASGNAATDVIIIGFDNFGDFNASAGGSLIVGNRALANLTGDNAATGPNTVIGIEAGELLTETGGNGMTECTIIGYRAARGLAVSTNNGANQSVTAIGFQAGERIRRDGFGTEECVLIGSNAGRGRAASDNSYTRSVFIGDGAGENISGSTDCIAIGASALAGPGSATAALSIVAIGTRAGDNITTGQRTVCIGTDAAGGMTTGDFNVSIGHNSSVNLNAGDRNIVIGGDAGAYFSAGDDNISIGYDTGPNAGDSTGTIIIGSQAGLGFTASNNRYVALGFNAARSGAGLTSDTFVIENSATAGALSAGNPARTIIYGDFVNGNVMIGSDNTAGGVPQNRGWGGGTNCLKIAQTTAAPGAGIAQGAVLFVRNTAGVFTLEVIGPGGVAQVLATGL